MRKTLSTSFGLFFVALLAIVGWYVWYTRQIQGKLDQFVQQAEQQKLVKVDFVVSAPEATPKDQTLYLSGSAAALGNWDAAGLPLQRGEDGRYRGSAEVTSGVEYGFKVTRGNWATVETDARGEESKDRTLNVPGPASVDVAVVSWRDGGKTVPNRATMTGEIRLHKKFHSNVLGNERTLVVYLPPDYDKDTSQKYPVLYMQDGQNLFDEATSYAGVEWKLDETAQRLITSKTIPPIIIVGIYNAGAERTDEFTPPTMSSDAKKARGDLYAKFVVDEVKPFIDKTYRTQPDRAHTAIGGGSMGGLIALHTAKQSPQTFGAVALMSPWLRIGEKNMLESDIGACAWAKDMRIYLEMGEEGGTLYPGKDPLGDAQALDKLFKSVGVDHVYNEVPGLEHNEAGWSTRVETMLKWVYGIADNAPPSSR
jgi:predicted alpha/beta superfamily hydrolase